MRAMILGLRRSGTTIFWRQFRRDDRLVCYDEPFNPKLAQLPQEHPKKVYAEFIRLYEQDPEAPGKTWRTRFAPIAPAEEPGSGLTEAQAVYLAWLYQTGEHVITDITRCAFKMEALARVVPDAGCIYLRRDPRGVATSHMLPSHEHPTLRTRVGRRLRELTFFSRRTGFDNWQFERILGAPGGPFDAHLQAAGFDPTHVHAWPAFAKVLAYWKAHDTRIASDGPRVFGDRFVTIEFEDFCTDPAKELARSYRVLGLDLPTGLDFSSVRPASDPFKPGDARWKRWLDAAGLSSAGL